MCKLCGHNVFTLLSQCVVSNHLVYHIMSKKTDIPNTEYLKYITVVYILNYMLTLWSEYCHDVVFKSCGLPHSRTY